MAPPILDPDGRWLRACIEWSRKGPSLSERDGTTNAGNSLTNAGCAGAGPLHEQSCEQTQCEALAFEPNAFGLERARQLTFAA